MKISLTDKLSTEKPIIEINGKEYQVDNRRDTVFKVTEKLESASDLSGFENVIEIVLGEDAKKEIIEMNLPLADYQVIIIGIFAAMNNEPYEDIEKRFQQLFGNV